MLAEFVLAIFVIVVLAVLIRALRTGRIEWSPAGASTVADRTHEPGAFWTIFCLGVGAVCYMLWLILT